MVVVQAAGTPPCGGAYTDATMRRRVPGWWRSLEGGFSGRVPGKWWGDAPVHEGGDTPEQEPPGPPVPESQPDLEEVGRKLESGLGEVKQYLGVLRRQNIAMSIKVARTERQIEELSTRLEALSARLESVGDSQNPSVHDPERGGLAEA